MKAAEKVTSICGSCGHTLESATDFGCPVCLLNLGLDDGFSDRAAEEPHRIPGEFGAYTIQRHEDGSLRELGRGAMGVTYRAIDTSLNREVALKIIRAGIGLSNADARERFMREARAAAALRHPHVATVYHFGIREETGQCFCAMELIEGETLEERVRRSGPLDVDSVVEIARQITAALAEAEKRGLVHRDLKPANIMIQATESEPKSSELTVKIIDFGVAKALAETPDARVLTHHGFIGTPAFASPEQFINAPVDVRSDIYSLGATLWYLLTGQLILARQPSASDVNAPPVRLPVEQLKEVGVPSPLIALLTSMLAPAPGARPAVHELTKRLEAIQKQIAEPNRARRLLIIAGLLALASVALFFVIQSTGPGQHRATKSLSEKSIAVLPLENLSAEQENAFFADGLQDEISTNLAKVADLKVISRSSVLQYKSSAARDLPQIVRELGVAHVLEGSVQRTGDQLRVNVQLIDGRSNAHVWSHVYDRKMTDLFAMQSEIARTVAEQLQARLSPQEKAAMDQPPTANLPAYALYLRAREMWDKPGGIESTIAEDMKSAEEWLTEAVRLDPNFVLAHCELARVYDTRYWNEIDQTPECRARGDAAIETATRLAPDSGEVHLARGLHFYQGYRQYRWARAEFDLARKVLPNEPRVYLYTCYLDRREGRWEEATKNMERACALDPANIATRFELADVFMCLKEYGKARAALAGVPASGVWGEDLRTSLASADIHEKADFSGLRAIVPEKRADGSVPLMNVSFAMFERDPDRAEQLLAKVRDGDLPPTESRGRWEGVIARLRKDDAAVRRAYEKARAEVAAALQAKPEDPELTSVLGLMNANLGEKEEALRLGHRAIELLPLDHDAIKGIRMAVNLVFIYGWVGEEERALADLRKLVRTPMGPSYGDLNLGVQYESLRGDPGFAEIVASLAPKGSEPPDRRQR